METKKPELAELRKQAGLSQSDLAEQLGITQSQVSEYEKKGEVPTHLLTRWARALGVTVDELLPPEPIENASFDFDDRLYATLTEDLNLLLQYTDRFPNPEQANNEAISPTIPQLRDQVTTLKEKPWVVVTGHFDSGKSTVCNFLLGGGKLPIDYQPETKFPIYIRHSADRPDWITADLWLMGSDFDPRKWQDEPECVKHFNMAGSWDTLKEYASLKSSQGKEQGIVLAFADAPLLHSCVLVDLPGYDDKQIKAELIDQAGEQANVLLYLSKAQGFLDSGNLTRLGHLLRSIPHFETVDDKFSTLGNLFIIASHVHPGIKTKQLNGILEGGARKFYEHFEGTLLQDLKTQTGREITLQDVTNRFFSFWQEESSRREKLEKELHTLLGTHLPTIVKNLADEVITKFKKEGTAQYAQAVERWETILREKNKGKADLQKRKEAEPDRQRRHKRAVEIVEQKSATCKNRDLKYTQQVFRAETAIESLEEMIDRRYSDKKTAQELAANYVLEKIQSETARFRAELVDDFMNSIEEFLQDADKATFRSEKWGTVTTPIDTKAAFLGGLAGAGTLGALGAWAAGLGNLGSYIVAAKGASLLGLSSVSASGAAGVSSAIAALGGPITLGIGIAIAAGVLVWRFFAGNWKYRLAKKIKQVFEEKRVLSSSEGTIKSFWDSTLTAFQKGADNMDTQHRNYIEEMEVIFGGPQENLQVLEQRINRYQELKSFFAAIPWRWKT